MLLLDSFLFIKRQIKNIFCSALKEVIQVIPNSDFVSCCISALMNSVHFRLFEADGENKDAAKYFSMFLERSNQMVGRI